MGQKYRISVPANWQCHALPSPDRESGTARQHVREGASWIKGPKLHITDFPPPSALECLCSC